MDSAIIQNIFSSLPVGLLVINPAGEIHIANEAASEILGFDRETIIGKGWGELFFDAPENDAFNQVFVDVIRERTLNLHRTVPYINKTGNMLHLSMTTSFLTVQGRLEGIVVLIDDVTDLYLLREREKATMEERSRFLREKAESLNKMALAVAHQLRNPLTAIGGFAKLVMKRTGNNENISRYLSNILSDVSRLEKVVKTVEEYSRIQSAFPRTISAAELINDVLGSAGPVADANSKEISWKISIQENSLKVDPGLFVMAINEIVKNAIESFKNPEGEISIRVFREGVKTVVEVTDNGSGIGEADLPFIFDPFYSTKATGIGMGLCKTQRIVSEHNGRIVIDSAVGVGTRVRIELTNQITEREHPSGS